ncbi:damage-control phosphatase ARMT1 [Amyelois transitella]|uniref:damage-control phosphatase ARMT1 n=1 Tax=Amyelois transitella TaxID=680683 RepID=UPI00299050C4|nr:damage-control phosphatase ARMT1 [Amyelois transitella]
MSKTKIELKGSPRGTPRASLIGNGDDEDGTKPDFIYGGPFIPVEKPSPFLSTSTPINIQLQGTFKKSFAFHCLKERLPVILTKIIDYCSRKGSAIKSANSATDSEIQNFIHHVTKLKNDLVTNKSYDPLTVDTEEAKKWNNWISSQNNSKYFTNIYLFTECYVYRKIREACELNVHLLGFDPFEEQKHQAFEDTLEMTCIVAEKMADMLPQSDKDKRKQDFITLLKLCLWANRCDLSLTAGNALELKSDANSAMDPFQMIIDWKDKILVDDSAKAADQVVAKAEAIGKAIEGNTTFKFQCSCHRLATLAGMPLKQEPAALSNSGSPVKSPPPEPEAAEELPKVPCPAKMTIPQAVIFDIVCDNAGYELFCDFCLAHFLVSQKIVQKVRFHVKRIPWFVSDVTPKDFNYVIQACRGANFSKTITPEPKPAPADGTEPPEPDPPRQISSNAVRELANAWSSYVDDGTFIVMDDEYWTYPHPYKDMKKYSPLMFRKLQYACAILFKGDLNYRKLMGEMNWPSTQSFDASLQGFNPAPIIAARTVKTELICGLPKGKADLLNKADEKWMQAGNYGVIQFSGKAEPLKVSDRPCEDYGEVCFGTVCPVHSDM